MQTLRTIYISTAEWRWVIVVSGLLVTLTLVPYAWALARNQSAEEWHFMGMLSNPRDGATYLAKIERGHEGAWLYDLRYTPETHDSAGFNTFYIFLGHAARVTALSNLVVFHLTRVATSLFMFISLYQLGATVWMRLRPRRVFFTLLAAGSGLGWLLLIMNSNQYAADLSIPEAFPFYAAYTNPHFPLSIACLALIVSVYMIVFRRGYEAAPSVDNGGLGILLLSMLLALIQPTALIPIAGALALYVLVRFNFTRQIPLHELRWSAMLWLPVIPFAAYYAAVLRFNDMMREFNQQNQTPSPAIHLYLFGYGLLLILAIPGLVRAVRRFERDGDQLMLLWIIVNAICLYAPINLQRRLALGLIIPLVYFAVRALEDYWFYRVPEKWRAPGMIALIVFIVPTNVLVLLIPLFGAVAQPESGLDNGMLLETDYWNSIEWLQQNGEESQIALASPNVSQWIPAYTDLRVVYGHPLETVPADDRQDQVEDWYRGLDCATLLGETIPFQVKYILWGPQERALDEDKDTGETYPDTGKCVAELPAERVEQEVNQGEVTIYVLH